MLIISSLTTLHCMYKTNNEYSSVKLYGFGPKRIDYNSKDQNQLYTDELYLRNYMSYKISTLLKYISKGVPFQLEDINMYIDGCSCDEFGVLPAGKTLHIIHKSFKKYLVTFQSVSSSSSALVDDLPSALNIFNKYFEDFTISNVLELNWNGTTKKNIAQKITKSTTATSLPKNAVLMEYNWEIRNNYKIFDKHIQNIKNNIQNNIIQNNNIQNIKNNINIQNNIQNIKNHIQTTHSYFRQSKNAHFHQSKNALSTLSMKSFE
jgi:hypothetical protein